MSIHPGRFNGELYVRGDYFIYWPERPYIEFEDPNAVIASRANEITFEEAEEELMNLCRLKDSAYILEKWPPVKTPEPFPNRLRITPGLP